MKELLTTGSVKISISLICLKKKKLVEPVGWEAGVPTCLWMKDKHNWREQSLLVHRY